VNDYLAKTLMAARPDYGWLSEETKDDHSRHACPRSFVMDQMFEAYLGGGAKLNGKPLSIPDSDKIEGIRMVGYPRKFRRLGWPDMTCRVVNSMAYRMALVASDKADATVAFTPKSDWDLAAAQLIATEAGGLVTNLYGKVPSFDGPSTSGLGVICAGPKLHALLLATR